MGTIDVAAQTEVIASVEDLEGAGKGVAPELEDGMPDLEIERGMHPDPAGGIASLALFTSDPLVAQDPAGPISLQDIEG
jgi:hypothetical protein